MTDNDDCSLNDHHSDSVAVSFVSKTIVIYKRKNINDLSRALNPDWFRSSVFVCVKHSRSDIGRYLRNYSPNVNHVRTLVQAEIRFLAKTSRWPIRAGNNIMHNEGGSSLGFLFLL